MDAAMRLRSGDADTGAWERGRLRRAGRYPCSELWFTADLQSTTRQPSLAFIDYLRLRPVLDALGFADIIVTLTPLVACLLSTPPPR
jgi:hypothetical protein